MNKWTCKECNREFGGKRGLHIHLKTHGGKSKYYHKYFPRHDKQSGKPIPYKSYEQYFSTLFSSQASRELFYRTASQQDVHDAIRDEWMINLKTKDLSFLPPETFFMLSNICTISDIRRSFGSTQQFCKEMRLEQKYDAHLPADFWNTPADELEMEVLIDTREQQPFKYAGSKVQKLSIGDYMTAGKHFSKVAVDRKSTEDFKGSFGGQIDRIRNSLQLADDMGYRIYYVVEGKPDQMEAEAKRNKWDRTRWGYIYRNVREALVDFTTTQIIFCNNRNEAQKLTRKILYYGEQLWRVDLQYFLNIN